MGVCNCSMFCCTLLYVHSSIAVILMGKRELIALLNLSSWCLVMVERLFLAVPRGCLQFAIAVFPDHTHLLFFSIVKHDPVSINYVKLLHYNSEITAKSALIITEDGDSLFHEFNGPFRIIIFSCNFCKRTLPVLNIPH